MADSAVRVDRLRRLADCRLYLCTGFPAGLPALGLMVEAAVSGGVGAVQLREKGLEAGAELTALAVVARACRSGRALVSVNDRADLAVVADADLLHLGQGDLTAGAARRIVGPDVLIGVSTHTAEQAAAAVADPAVDYLCAGPVWATPTKPGRVATGVELVRAVGTLAGSKPWFAIGGITGDNLDQVLAAGARRVVVVRALTEAGDPRAAASALATRVREVAGCD